MKILIFYTLLLYLPVFLTFLTIQILKLLYNGPLLYLRNALRRENKYNKAGFLTEYNRDITYYNRKCTSEDISTRDANDLLLNSNQSSEEIANIMLEHGAVVIPNVLNDSTAMKLREYLESRNEIDENGLGYHEKMWSEMGRLALGLGRDDHPIIAQALEEVGNNELVTKMLKGIVGDDPALVELSTLTAKYGCEEQGIHTDSDYYGSSLLYSRTFLHSYTMFMALQDTTSKMGATTLCPGTHMCANDLEELCSNPDNIFEASSNGATGNGVLQTGDAMMFNQNIWHRGPSNNDPLHPINRVMFILTFVSRRRLRDNRIQGLGTYYYYRWNQWGHTFHDLKHSSRFSLPWSILKALGLKVDETEHMGIPWVEHFARQISNAEDFYADDELPEFRNYVARYIPSAVEILSNESKWEEFLTETLNTVCDILTKIYLISLFIFIVVCCISGKVAFTSLLLGHAAILLLFTIIYQSILNHSYLGKQIKSNQLLFQPFPTTKQQPNKQTVPERMDVLFQTRFNADYLESYNRIIEFHPGNRMFSHLVQQSLCLNELAVGFIYQSLQQPIKGVVPRMLLQDYATGYWMIMDESQCKRKIHEVILEEKFPLIKALSYHLKSVLANARFGVKRDLVMTRRFTEPFVLRWQEILFEDTNAAKLASPIKRNLWKIKSHLIPPSSTKMSLSSLTNKVYNIGDRVLANYGDEGRYYEATIIDILRQGQYYTISFTEEEDYILTTHFESLRPYKPFSQGDLVEVNVDDDWLLVLIVEASPFGVYTVEYIDSDIREFDISKDSIRWPTVDDESSNDPQESEEDISFQVGDLVRAYIDSYILPGTIINTDDDTATIQFHNGYEDDVSLEWVRPLVPFQLGQRVRAKVEEDEDEYFPGFIAKLNNMGDDIITHDISFEDGDFVDYVPSEWIIQT